MLAFAYAVATVVGPAAVETTAVLARRANNVAWTYITPVINLGYETYERAVAGMRPLPAVQGDPETVWETKSFPLFVLQNDLAADQARQNKLMDFFIDDTKRASLENPKKLEFLRHYVLCALHQARRKPATPEHAPNLGLDLLVLYGCRSIYDDNYVVEHYRSEFFGAHRLSLFDNALKVCNKNPNMLRVLRENLTNSESLLYRALKDHRLPISYKGLTESEPDTIKELKAILDLRIAKHMTETALAKRPADSSLAKATNSFYIKQGPF